MCTYLIGEVFQWYFLKTHNKITVSQTSSHTKYYLSLIIISLEIVILYPVEVNLFLSVEQVAYCFFNVDLSIKRLVPYATMSNESYTGTIMFIFAQSL